MPYPLASNAESPLFFSRQGEGFVQCDLCPNNCRIKSGDFGLCKVRGNKNGKPIIPFYGFVTSLAVDPVEKKPLYHFKPGSPILSAGFTGCNLRCPFCQNWHISQNTDASGKLATPGEIVSAALRSGCPSIAYTYSEPLVHIEYLLSCMKAARDNGIANVLVTNGCINRQAACEILALTDAANIDLKGYSEETYKKTLGGNLETVLNFIRLAYSTGVHVEVTTLIVSGLNDNDDELDRCSDFIADICAGGNPTGEKNAAENCVTRQIPWHLSAYHPDYRWNAPATDRGFLLRAAERARKKLDYVYCGNISGEENDTRCSCGAILVRRRGYNVDTKELAHCGKFYRCSRCGKETGIVA